MTPWRKILALLEDPPPEFVFEIAPDSMAISRTRGPAALQQVALPAGTLAVSPVKDNVQNPEALAEAVTRLVPAGAGRRTAALILPDNSLRVAVLDFESLPDKEEERLSLIKFRLRKTLPFDIDAAALSYYLQSRKQVIAAVAPVEVITRYEAPFRAANLHPGFVTVSSLAMMESLPATGSFLVARRSLGSLTVLALRNGALTLIRSLELPHDAADPLEEVSSDIYPTIVYLEDQTGERPSKLILAGFGDESGTSATRLSIELDIPVEAIDDPYPGLSGYLKSLGAAAVKTRAAA